MLRKSIKLGYQLAMALSICMLVECRCGKLAGDKHANDPSDTSARGKRTNDPDANNTNHTSETKPDKDNKGDAKPTAPLKKSMSPIFVILLKEFTTVLS